MLLKLHVTVAIIVCIYFVQMGQCVDEQTMKEYLKYYEVSEFSTYLNGSDAIKDIGPQFVEDMHLILEKFDNNPYITRIILSTMKILAIHLNGKNVKISLSTMKEHIAKIKAIVDEGFQMESNMCPAIDFMNILQSILLKQLPPERISGLINFFYVLNNFGAEKDLENTLEYIYGTNARQTTVNPNIKLLYSQNCAVVENSKILKYIKSAIDGIKSINSTKLNPKILNDAQIIAYKFPYTSDIIHPFDVMKELLIKLDEKNSTSDICEMKNLMPQFEDFYRTQSVEIRVIELEILLSARVPEENFMDMMNLIRAGFWLEGCDWKRAVEYAYPDFFKADSCH